MSWEKIHSFCDKVKFVWCNENDELLIPLECCLCKLEMMYDDGYIDGFCIKDKQLTIYKDGTKITHQISRLDSKTDRRLAIAGKCKNVKYHFCYHTETILLKK